MSKKHKEARKAQRQSLYTPEETTKNDELNEEVSETVVEEEVKEETPVEEVIIEETEMASDVTEGVAVLEKEPKGNKTQKADKSEAKDAKKDNKKKDKKKEKKKGLIKKTKETASELKKVTWPTFAEVIKKTGIVVAFVIIFGLLIFGVDMLLGWLVELLLV